MLRKLSIALLAALIAQQVATAQQNPGDPLGAAAQAAAAAFDNPDPQPPPPPEPLPAPVADAETGLPDDAAQMEVPGNGEILVTGPLHEAYAEQFTSEPIPGLTVSKQPPEAIDEIPPEYRPDGHNVAWVPGYWGWDADRDDFVWVTGIWRQMPPGRSWIPGYWTQVPEGYQWISGFWAPGNEQEFVYLPPPPEPVDAAPSTDPPGDNYFWVPGQWVWIDNDYHWRAGYWALAYPDWTWVPERYVYTPSGYIYRAGYWDYLLTDRGTIFCPVYWAQPVATYRLRPTYVINPGTSLLANLFVYPQYHHYYFGNYYSSRYLGQSIYPWVTVSQQTRFYDPLYGYYQTQHRDVAFLQRITRMHTYYASNPQFQPAQTLAMQLRAANPAQAGNVALQAVQLQTLVNNRESPMQFVRLNNNQQQQLQKAIEPARALRTERAKAEVQSSTSVAGNAPADQPGAAKLGPDGQKGRGGRGGNRWRLPSSNDGVTLGAAALVAGQQSDGGPGRGDRTEQPGNAPGAGGPPKAQLGADKTNLPADAAGRTAGRRNGDRPGAGASIDRPDDNKPAGDKPAGDKRAGDNAPGKNRRGVDRTDVGRATDNVPGANAIPGAAAPGAKPPQPGAPDLGGRSANRPGTDANRAGADRPGAGKDRPGFKRPPENRPDGIQPGDNQRGTPPTKTPGDGKGRANAPGLGGLKLDPNLNRNPPSSAREPGAAAAQNSIQDDMRALHDMQRRDTERRRAAPPDLRSLPDRPQPAPGAEHPKPDRGRNSGIVPGAGVPGAGAPNPGGGGDAKPGRGNPGRGNSDGGRGNDKGKDKGKDKK